MCFDCKPSPEGQIAFPKNVRDRLNLKPGTELATDVHGESLVIKSVARELPDWRRAAGASPRR